ncbi:hypothetical protein [Nocardia sp. CY41]|uniref:hypothetical protein n=1 Tax=Nocardia sp. CY41 TaxID=2608686 RepID=UPI00135B690F|nr:hypothetical protein [Nocardia sp. CY41]
MFLTSRSLPSVPNAWMQVYMPVDEVAWGTLRALLAMSLRERRRPWVENRELYHAAAG